MITKYRYYRTNGYMNTKFLLVIFLSSMIMILSGCRTSPVYNIQDQSLIIGKSEFSEYDIRKSIVRAGSRAGWNMNADNPVMS